MARNKALKKREFNESPICVNNDPAQRGQWQAFFGNSNPITLEIGCGKGDLAIGLAQKHPERNYIGIDIKGVRMWTGAMTAEREGMKNIGFLRCDIHGIERFFDVDEVDEIWITFPDPFPRKKGTKNRLIHEGFLRQYAKMLRPGGEILFKTDNKSLFTYALEHFAELNEKEVFHIEVLEQTRDLHASDLKNADNGITTDYERRFLDMGKTINYMRLRLAAGPNIDKVPATEKISLDPTEKAPRLR